MSALAPRVCAFRARPRLLATRRHRAACVAWAALLFLVGPVMLAGFLALDVLGVLP